MGYYVSVGIYNVCVRRYNFAALLTAINAMEHVGRDNEPPFESLEEAFRWWGHSVSIDEKGLTLDYREAEKWHDEESLYRTMAPFVVWDEDDEGAITCDGEDDEHWRYVFRDGQMIEQHGRIVYDEDL